MYISRLKILLSQKHLCKLDLMSQAGVNEMAKIKGMSKVLNEVNSIICN